MGWEEGSTFSHVTVLPYPLAILFSLKLLAFVITKAVSDRYTYWLGICYLSYLFVLYLYEEKSNLKLCLPDWNCDLIVTVAGYLPTYLLPTYLLCLRTVHLPTAALACNSQCPSSGTSTGSSLYKSPLFESENYFPKAYEQMLLYQDNLKTTKQAFLLPFFRILNTKFVIFSSHSQRLK